MSDPASTTHPGPSTDPDTGTPHGADVIALARAAAVDAADGEAAQVGERSAVVAEDAPDTATYYFAAAKPGYRGWSWAVTVVGPDGHEGSGEGSTVSEVVLLPGADAIVAPTWLPWNERVRAEDLGPGDVLPVDADDERLVPAHAVTDETTDPAPGLRAQDPADAEQVRVVADELGLGRPRVMSPEGRLDAAVRWADGDFGPGADMARAAAAPCGTCGFYLLLAGGLRGAFGVCGNGHVPADGHVVHVEYGCGGHSELAVDTGSAIAVAELVYDDGVDMEPAGSAS